jgi:hypothetical protein
MTNCDRFWAPATMVRLGPTQPEKTGPVNSRQGRSLRSQVHQARLNHMRLCRFRESEPRPINQMKMRMPGSLKEGQH